MTDSTESRVSEDQFLGALLGMAIGDALGVPLRGKSVSEIQTEFGEVNGYLTPPDPKADSQSPIGQISDKSEIALCIVESLTTNDGVVDFENIAARMAFVARSPSQATMSAITLAGIERSVSDETDLGEQVEDPEELAVASRGVPFGLVHAIGVFDLESLQRETTEVTRLTHRGDIATRSTLAVALHIAAASRQPNNIDGWLARHRIDSTSLLVSAISRIGAVIGSSSTFEEGVLEIVREGGESDSLGSIAGAIAGARFGASGIPQQLIDDLDARIYLTLAAPWFYRTALRRQGTVIDLRTV